MDRTLARQAGLLIAVFVATLILLAGGWTLISERGASQGSAEPSSVAGSAAPAQTASSSPEPPSSASGSAGSPDTTAFLTGAGDIADCTFKGAAQTSDLLVNQPGTIFTAGNNAYPTGSDQDFASCYEPTWGRLKDRTLPAPGNQDYRTAHATGYLGYFGSAAAPDGTTWYSTDLGTWHVIVLDSNCSQVGGCGADSRQGVWLAADLKAHPDTRCTLAIWHYPRFSSGANGDNRAVGPFWDQLIAAHADLVINAHDADYERFAPQNAAGVEDRKLGMREFVVGTGGTTLTGFPSQAANSEFRYAGVWGVIRLTLHPANYDWEFLPVSGRVTDSGSALCH